MLWNVYSLYSMKDSVFCWYSHFTEYSLVSVCSVLFVSFVYSNSWSPISLKSSIESKLLITSIIFDHNILTLPGVSHTTITVKLDVKYNWNQTKVKLCLNNHLFSIPFACKEIQGYSGGMVLFAISWFFFSADHILLKLQKSNKSTICVGCSTGNC